MLARPRSPWRNEEIATTAPTLSQHPRLQLPIQLVEDNGCSGSRHQESVGLAQAALPKECLFFSRPCRLINARCVAPGTDLMHSLYRCNECRTVFHSSCQANTSFCPRCVRRQKYQQDLQWPSSTHAAPLENGCPLAPGQPRRNWGKGTTGRGCGLGSKKACCQLHILPLSWALETSVIEERERDREQVGRTWLMPLHPSLSCFRFPQPSFCPSFQTSYLPLSCAGKPDTHYLDWNCRRRHWCLLWVLKLAHFVAEFLCLLHFTTGFLWNAMCQTAAESSGNTFHPSTSCCSP